MLDRCLRSLAAQRHPPRDVIVVDNASSDDSAELARAYGARVVREDRPGITAAASAGYDAATGWVIARCDADSELPPDWVARIHAHFVADSTVVAVTGRGRFYGLGLLGRLVADLFYMRAYFWGAHAAVAHVPVFGSNFAVRTDAWLRVSGQVPRDDEWLHDDFDLSFRLPSRGVVYDPGLVVGISGRPFRSASAMVRRFRMGAATVAHHFRMKGPVARWRERLKSVIKDA